MMEIAEFGLIYVRIVQGIGQARWCIPKGVAFGKDTTPCKCGGWVHTQ